MSKLGLRLGAQARDFKLTLARASHQFAGVGWLPRDVLAPRPVNRLLRDTPEARDDVMTMTTTDNLSVARKYLEALEGGAEGGALADYFTADVVQEEYPNRLSPIGAHRDLDA